MWNDISDQPASATRAAINLAYLRDEDAQLAILLPLVKLGQQEQAQAAMRARQFVHTVRESTRTRSGIESILQEYDLSTQEGILLMSLAEALLRIPDAATADALIRDKFTNVDWDRPPGRRSSRLINLTALGLRLAGWLVRPKSPLWLDRMLQAVSLPLIRMTIKQTMRLVGHHFVLGRTIDTALSRSRRQKNRHSRYSFDMLGEAALTASDAKRYLAAYQDAIVALGKQAGQAELFERPSISVKLSALHPRYEYSQRQRIHEELSPRLLELALAAKAANISMTIDAEETERLDLLLDMFASVYRNHLLTGWHGFGLAVQAYQKRAIHVIDWLARLADAHQRPIPVRLVKGAYWDTEIKLAQERGLEGYPVFTRKAATDVSYLACARRLLDHGALFYPQFATHNAHTVATLIVMAGERAVEFQRLHGMGETLYCTVLEHHPQHSCRIYAPVGDHKTLLPYLVRRLLENGANSSFVNQIANEQIALEEIVANPLDKLASSVLHIPAPRHLYGGERLNASGLNLADNAVQFHLAQAWEKAGKQSWQAAPIVNGQKLTGNTCLIHNPADRDDIVGEVSLTDTEAADQALDAACQAASGWADSDVGMRAACLEQAAELLEAQMVELMSLIIREGGRTIPDALNEVRETIDFCRYYAVQARQHFAHPITLPGVTGESNQLRWVGRGVFICISPWNFPAAIFTGQIAAALVAGNSVIAKPAAPTPLSAAYLVDILHQAGIPQTVLHFLPGSGSQIGMQLVSDPRIAGVAFTGSTSTARQINQALAQRERILPFIAETGGQNCMLVDSSALPEQVVQDVIASSFNSAGQRCSALRVLYLQQEIAPQIITMLSGAMDELRIGNPMQLSTDIGPIISDSACAELLQHCEHMHREAHLIKALQRPPACASGSFFPPHVYEIETLDQLQHEVFGPVLHIIRYSANQLDAVIAAINRSGYGLTLGIHSRIESRIDYIQRHTRCGNTYANRNMIGAVVGSQPFGGEGLSGTGPKAGGPHYLQRFATERVITVNTAAVGGNAALLSGSVSGNKCPMQRSDPSA